MKSTKKGLRILGLSAAIAIVGLVAAGCGDGANGPGPGPQPESYTVTYQYEDGSVFATRRVEDGKLAEDLVPDAAAGSVELNPRESGLWTAGFVGWSLAGAEDPYNFAAPVKSDITLVAKYGAVKVEDYDADDLAAAVARVNADPRAYALALSQAIQAGPQTLTAGSLTIVGIGGPHEISLGSNGALFALSGEGTSLTLGNGVALVGRAANSASLVVVEAGANLVMLDGSEIRGNAVSGHWSGGGVRVSGGAFDMRGGAIRDNEALGENSGGGLFVAYDGVVEMSGGEISGNAAAARDSGGGVFVRNDGDFVMSAGEISGNKARGENSGGGVFVFELATFDMKGGAISDNKATGDRSGGGVYVEDGTFKMRGGEIHGNVAQGIYSGGGAYARFGAFLVENGVFHGQGSEVPNVASGYGSLGPLYVYVGSDMGPGWPWPLQRGNFDEQGVFTFKDEFSVRATTIRIVNGDLMQ